MFFNILNVYIYIYFIVHSVTLDQQQLMGPDEIRLEDLIAYIMTVCKQQNDKSSYIGSWSGKKLSPRSGGICSELSSTGNVYTQPD